MINLIPPEAQTRITVEYWVRVVTAWLFLVTIAATVVGALLLPAYVLVTTQVNDSAIEAEQARVQMGEQDISTKELALANESALLILEAKRQPRLLAVVDTIDGLVPSDVTITSYELARASSTVGPVSLRGTAASRAALAAFRDGLLRDKNVSQIDLPISNFAKDRDIQFSLTVTLSSSTLPL